MSDNEMIDPKAARARRNYLGIRLKELREELKGLQVERKGVADSLKAAKDPKSDEAKSVKARRNYIDQRMVDVRRELETGRLEMESLRGGSAG